MSSGEHPIVIGISGRLAAGKTTVALLLGRMGFHHLKDPQWDTALRFSRSFIHLHRTVPGRGAACMGLVIDGLRSTFDHHTLEAEFGESFVSIHVSAAREIRMLRRLGWSERDAEFYAADEAAGVSIDPLTALATHHISNDESVEALERQVSFIDSREIRGRRGVSANNI